MAMHFEADLVRDKEMKDSFNMCFDLGLNHKLYVTFIEMNKA
jgi:hypothetical protein